MDRKINDGATRVMTIDTETVKVCNKQTAKEARIALQNRNKHEFDNFIKLTPKQKHALARKR